MTLTVAKMKKLGQALFVEIHGEDGPAWAIRLDKCPPGSVGVPKNNTEPELGWQAPPAPLLLGQASKVCYCDSSGAVVVEGRFGDPGSAKDEPVTAWFARISPDGFLFCGLTTGEPGAGMTIWSRLELPA